MKKAVHCDERILNIRYQIYFKLFWIIVIGETLSYFIDSVCKSSLYGSVLSYAPEILIVWMAVKGVLFNGTDRFPKWCWGCAALYGLLNSVLVYCMSFRPESYYYLEDNGKRILAILAFFLLFFLLTLLFLYCVYRVARKKIEKQSAEE